MTKLLRVNLVDSIKAKGFANSQKDSETIKLVRKVFPPVLKYPSKHPTEWIETDLAMDPLLRPLEPGEDWAGNVKPRRECRNIRGQNYLMLHDYDTDGQMFIVVNKWRGEMR